MTKGGQATLLVQGGPTSGSVIPLTGHPVTFGRRSDNDLVVDETTVSRRHALILETPTGFVLRDLSTTNGTYVNLERIGHDERLLKHGDRIRLAGSDVTFIFRQEGPSTVRMAVESPRTGRINLSELEGRLPEKRKEPEPSLSGKDLELLRLLESQRGTVVTREELLRQVWPDLPVSDLTNQLIDQCIGRLRTQIEEDPLKPEHLISIGQMGFVLV